MIYWQNSDVPALIEGAGGVAVVHGGEGGKGLLDTPDTHTLPGMSASQISEHRLLTVQTSLFPTLKVGNTVTVGSVNHKVVDRQKLGDGALTQFLIRLPNP